MTVREALKKAIDRLKEIDIEAPVVDAGVLLCHVLGVDRAYIYTHGEYTLKEAQLRAYTGLIERRAKGEPVQYLTGHQEFMGLDFSVDKNVLIPRADTETLVEAVIHYVEKSIPSGESIHLMDIGTGSGCIAISLAYYLKQIRVTALDISHKALEIAKKNSIHIGTAERVEFRCSDLFNSLDDKYEDNGAFDIIVSNPPYIPSEDIEGLQVEVGKYEPLSALDGGTDGLDFYRDIISGSAKFLKPGGLLVLEAGYGQAFNIVRLMGENFRDIGIVKDIAGIDRVVMGRLKRKGN